MPIDVGDPVTITKQPRESVLQIEINTSAWLPNGTLRKPEDFQIVTRFEINDYEEGSDVPRAPLPTPLQRRPQDREAPTMALLSWTSPVDQTEGGVNNSTVAFH